MHIAGPHTFASDAGGPPSEAVDRWWVHSPPAAAAGCAEMMRPGAHGQHGVQPGVAHGAHPLAAAYSTIPPFRSGKLTSAAAVQQVTRCLNLPHLLPQTATSPRGPASAAASPQRSPRRATGSLML